MRKMITIPYEFDITGSMDIHCAACTFQVRQQRDTELYEKMWEEWQSGEEGCYCLIWKKYMDTEERTTLACYGGSGRSTEGPRGFTTGKKWTSYPILIREEKFVRTGTRTGIIVGMRTLSNGYNEHLGEDGVDYHRTESVTAYLVAWDILRKIDTVLPEDIKVIGEGPDQNELAPLLHSVRIETVGCDGLCAAHGIICECFKGVTSDGKFAVCDFMTGEE